MNAKDVLRGGFHRARMVTTMLLDDLDDADLLVRPADSANHIAWQLGHLIVAENSFGNMIREGSMPALPEGFAERHNKERAAADEAPDGNLLDSGRLHPAGEGAQWYGDTWEWTRSAYGAYPGFQPLAGSLGEYNGKFMCGQFVLRGGACVTSRDHVRSTYRNFFYPSMRWQFGGVRLAQDA